MAVVLPLRSLTKQYALEILRYHTHRNFIAYQSHRKKRLAEANRLMGKASL